jgi:hypothetical protein
VRKRLQALDKTIEKVKGKVERKVLEDKEEKKKRKKEEKAKKLGGNGNVSSDSEPEHEENEGMAISTGVNPGPSEATVVQGRTEPEQQQQSTTAETTNADEHASQKSSSPVFDPPAPALEDLSDIGDNNSENSDIEEENEHAFDHPSTYVSQRWIWIPRDPFGLSKELINDLHDAGIDASDEGADMDDKGIVEVTRNPPDEEWSGGRYDSEMLPCTHAVCTKGFDTCVILLHIL